MDDGVEYADQRPGPSAREEVMPEMGNREYHHIRAAERVRMMASGVHDVLYDEQNRIAMAVGDDGMMRTYSLGKNDVRETEEPAMGAMGATHTQRPWTHSVNGGRARYVGASPVYRACFSLDGSILALQRSQNEVQIVVEVSTSNTAPSPSQRSGVDDDGDGDMGGALGHEIWITTKRRKLDTIYEMFWTTSRPQSSPHRPALMGEEDDNLLCLATSSGVEILKIDRRRNAEKVVERKRLAGTRWSCYNADTGILLMASGQYCNRFTAYQFVNNVQREELIIGGGRKGAVLVKVPPFELPAPILLGETIKKYDVSIITVGKHIYVTHHQHLRSTYSSFATGGDVAASALRSNGATSDDSQGATSGRSESESISESMLVLYRIGCGRAGGRSVGVHRTHSLRLYSLSSVHVFVLDCVLAVYNIDNDVVVLYDIGGAGDRAVANAAVLPDSSAIRTRSGYGAPNAVGVLSSVSSSDGARAAAASDAGSVIEPLLAPLRIGNSPGRQGSVSRGHGQSSKHFFLPNFVLDTGPAAACAIDEHLAEAGASGAQHDEASGVSSGHATHVTISSLHLDLGDIVDTSVVGSLPAARAEVLDFLLRRSGNDDGDDDASRSPTSLSLRLLRTCLRDRRVDLLPLVADVVAVNVVRQCYTSCGIEGGGRLETVDEIFGGYDWVGRASGAWAAGDGPACRDRFIAASNLIRHVFLPAIYEHGGDGGDLCQMFVLYSVQEVRRALNEVIDSMSPSSHGGLHAGGTATATNGWFGVTTRQREDFVANSLAPGVRVFVICLRVLECMQKYLIFGVDANHIDDDGGEFNRDVLVALRRMFADIREHPPESMQSGRAKAEVARICESLEDPDLLHMNDCWSEVVARYLDPSAGPRVSAALNFARNHRVGSLPVKSYIDAALLTGNTLVATTAHRFCSTFVKGFEDIGGSLMDMEFPCDVIDDEDVVYNTAVEKLRRISMS